MILLLLIKISTLWGKCIDQKLTQIKRTPLKEMLLNLTLNNNQWTINWILLHFKEDLINKTPLISTIIWTFLQTMGIRTKITILLWDHLPIEIIVITILVSMVYLLQNRTRGKPAMENWKLAPGKLSNSLFKNL